MKVQKYQLQATVTLELSEAEKQLIISQNRGRPILEGIGCQYDGNASQNRANTKVPKWHPSYGKGQARGIKTICYRGVITCTIQHLKEIIMRTHDLTEIHDIQGQVLASDLRDHLTEEMNKLTTLEQLKQPKQ